MEFMIRFCISLFDLGVFWYYLHTFRKKKNVPAPVCAAVLLMLAAVWAVADGEENPYLNLLVLVLLLTLVSLFYDIKIGARVAGIVLFIGTGIVIEPLGMLLLYGIWHAMEENTVYQYYLVTIICALIRGNAVYLLCRLISRKNLNLLKLPKEIVGTLVLVFALSVANCCFITLLSIETDSVKSKIMCVSIIVSIIMTYYFMLYMVERFSSLVQKQHGDELYMEEMRHKEIYYAEAEKRNKYVQDLKHDLNNRLLGLRHLILSGDMETLEQQVRSISSELEQIDADSYSENPAVDSVLRIKFGIAKAEGIKVDTMIRIPQQVGMEYGDIGVLYGNLLDNALEACRKVPPEVRFIRLENRYLSGKLILVVTNSKERGINKELKTTKEDSCSHGRGIASVRRVVEKYNGAVKFTDKGEIFEVSAMLYGIGTGGKNADYYT